MLAKLVKTYKKMFIIIAMILILGGPVLIHILFLIPALFDVFELNVKEADVLSYYGTALSSTATVILGYIAIKQSENANSLSEKLLKAETMNKKAYVDLEVEKCTYGKTYGAIEVGLKFKKITDTPISDLRIESSERHLMHGYFSTNKKDCSVFISEFNNIGSRFNLDKTIYEYGFFLKDYEESMKILSFKVIIESLYGLETIQYFNVLMQEGTILDYKTVQEI